MHLGSMFFSPRGRIGRRDYWLYSVLNFTFLFLFAFVLYAVLAVLGYARPADGHGGGQWAYLYAPLYIWAGLCLTIKRCHDRGKTGWWALAGLVPVVGWVWAIVACGVLAGAPEENRFGPPP